MSGGATSSEFGNRVQERLAPMMPSSVLHVLDHTLPTRSGYTVRTGHILRAQQQLGYRLQLLSSPRQDPGYNGEAPISIEGALCWRTPATPEANRQGAGRLFRELIKQVRPDIVHIHSPALNFPPIWWAAGRKIPLVYEIRAFWEDAAVANNKTTEQSRRYRYTRDLETWICRQAAHVFTICDGLRRDLVLRGIAENKISVAPNVVDEITAPTGQAPDSIRRAVQGKTVLAFMGSFYAYEGIDILMQAFDIMAGHDDRLTLLIIGDGPERGHLQELHTRMRHAERIHLTGTLPHRDACACYSLCDAIVLPRRSTRLTELVTPMKIPEAQQHGVVVMASNVGGHREMIDDRRTGYLVDASSPQSLAADITAGLQQREQWPQLIAQAKESVGRQRSHAVLASAYHKVYQELLRN
jgi:PEP-CTERM/exosortase A-associated glycosyltransferase